MGKNADRKPVPAQDAATVILLKEGRDKVPFEVLLMRRHKKQSFMAGAYVFPGGALEERDMFPEVKKFTGEMDGDRARILLNEPELEPRKALGLFICAVREMFEESGVLLARDGSGRMLSLNGDGSERFSAYRKEVHRDDAGMFELAEREGIVYALDRLVPYARWIAPAVEKKRFDARFFVARLPREQDASHDRIELTDTVWMSPEEALTRQARQEILLFPPTLVTLMDISEFGSLDELMNHAREKELFPTHPQAYKVEGGFGVKLPHDPEYDIEGYKRPEDTTRVSRVELRDGKWTARCYDDPST